MRPIDADALADEIRYYKEKQNFPANGDIAIFAISCLVHAPTLDAIVLDPSLLKCSKCGYILYKREWLYKHLDQEFSILASASGQSRPRLPTGHWEETKVVDVEGCHIDQLQSARCSVCGRYHTAPYMYSWTHYDFCPHCGAKMERK